MAEALVAEGRKDEARGVKRRGAVARAAQEGRYVEAAHGRGDACQGDGWVVGEGGGLDREVEGAVERGGAKGRRGGWSRAKETDS